MYKPPDRDCGIELRTRVSEALRLLRRLESDLGQAAKLLQLRQSDAPSLGITTLDEAGWAAGLSTTYLRKASKYVRMFCRGKIATSKKARTC